MTTTTTPEWYAMSAPYRNEMKAKQLLDDKGVDNFIPLCSKIIVGRDGRKKRKVVPIVASCKSTVTVPLFVR